MIDISIEKASEYTVSGKQDIKSVCIGIHNTLRFVFDKEPLTNVLYWASKDRRINAQSSIRERPELFERRAIVEVPTKGRGRVVNRKANAEAYLASLPADERLALLAEKTGIPVEKLKAMQPPSVEPLK